MKVCSKAWFALAVFFHILYLLKPYCQNSFKDLKKFPMHDSVVLAYQITSAFIEKKAKTLKYKVI